jgi:lipid-binding SYLF domain-containing protein
MKFNRRSLFAFAVAATALCSMGLLGSNPVRAATSEDLNRDAEQALQRLYRANDSAAKIGKIAKAALVFPNVVKAGLIFGGGYGEGVLLEGLKPVDYYNSVTGSWGLQAGAQSYGYVVFLMNDKARSYLRKSKGWEIGVGPTVVLVNEGVAKNLSSTTLQDDAYAFIFDQQGLMASVSIEGTKISRIKR